jgi:hypothetical protein
MKCLPFLLLLFLSTSLFGGQTVSTIRDYRALVREAAQIVNKPGLLIVSRSSNNALVVLYPLNNGAKEETIKSNDTVKTKGANLIISDMQAIKNGESGSDNVIHFNNKNDRYIGSIAVYNMSNNRWVKADPQTAQALLNQINSK